MKVLIDSNILLRLLQDGHEHHQPALLAVTNLKSQSHELLLLPQNIYEFWAVATRPLGENGLALSTEETRLELLQYSRMFRVLPELPEVYLRWMELVLKHDVKGKNTHDARLVAGMKVHGISSILTFNIKHFTRYTDLTLLNPVQVGGNAGSPDASPSADNPS